jgi:Tol biopolymer transport system component
VAGPRQRLVLVTGQFFSDGVLDSQGVGVQRRHTRIGGLVYRSDGSDFIAPTFGRIEAQVVGGTVAFSVDVTDRRPSGPGQVVRVLVGFRDGTGPDWRFVDLVESSPGTWTGGAPVTGDEIEYFVQAVDGGSGGNVAVSTNKGFYYEALPAPPPPTGGLDPDLTGPVGQNGWFTGDVSVVIGAPEDVTVEISVDDGEFVDGAGATIEGDGVHTVRVRASNGGTAILLVPIDGTGPDVQITSPENGARYDLDAEVLADFACPDVGSGAVTCVGTVADGARIDTSSPGTKTFSVTSRDAAGNTTTRSVSYTVVARRRAILFASSRTGNGDIYSVDEGGGGLVRLTAHSAIDAEPAWSPDGTKIAFTSTRNGNVEIYSMNADGSNVQRLTSNSALDLSPAWSPDGSKIAFASNRGNNLDVYVMNANGSNVKRLTTHKDEDLLPTWSPNGQKIAFTSSRTGGTDIYVMNASNGGSQTRLTTSSALDAEPDWSPDGTKIVFSTNRHGHLNFELYSMNATNGSAQTRLTNNSAAETTPSYSPDGARIVFSSTRNGNLELYAMDAAGGAETRVTNNPAIDVTPDW